MSRIEAAAIRYVLARRARITAKQGWHDYLTAAWANGPRHAYGYCRVPLDQYGTEAPLCDICKDSDPHYQAYRAAANKSGGAHRALMRIVERTPPQGQ